MWIAVPMDKRDYPLERSEWNFFGHQHSTNRTLTITIVTILLQKCDNGA